jgi:uncharacterized surface protein with fasciclin (FAS1) repeats
LADDGPTTRARGTDVKTSTGTKWFGGVAAITAIAVSLPVAATAYGDPEPTPTPTTTATISTSPIPNPEGPGCGAYTQQVPAGAGSVTSMATEPVGTALANIPMLTTFNAAISGQLNPQVNLVNMLNNGPYVVFAPVNDAFAKLPAEQLDALKTNPTALTNLLYYHLVLSLLGPQDVHGELTTQLGKQVTVKGKGGDITVDDAKVVCGGIHASNAVIYLIDTVLDPATATQSTSTDTTSATPPTTTTTAPSSTAARPA